jgi:hypothetical protein
MLFTKAICTLHETSCNKRLPKCTGESASAFAPWCLLQRVAVQSTEQEYQLDRDCLRSVRTAMSKIGTHSRVRQEACPSRWS